MKEKILEILMNSKGYVSGQAVSQQLGVSRQAVSKAIAVLREQGFEIDSVPNKGYKLSSSPDFLNSLAVKSGLKTAHIGKSLIILDSVDSTNDYLKSAAASGAESGTVAAAREQTKGKGRLGRAWQDKKDESIAFSVLLRPELAPYEVSAVTPLAGLAVCKALRKLTGLDCRIKWPNDIIFGNKKLVGILTEMSAEFDAVEYIIIGIGINVSQKQFGEDIAHKATSLLLETGKQINKNIILAEVLNQLEEELLKDNLRLSNEALAEYASLCATVGRSVTFTRGAHSLSGTAVDIDSNGELRVMLPDGTIRTVNSGEVTVQGIY